MTEFIKEDKYIVLKRRDVESALDKEMQQILQYLCQKVEAERYSLGKLPLECVCIESDWKIYPLAWTLVESEFNGAPIDVNSYQTKFEKLKEIALREREWRLEDYDMGMNSMKVWTNLGTRWIRFERKWRNFLTP